MYLKLEQVDLDPMLRQWVEDQGISLEGKTVIFKPVAGRRSNKGTYYIEAQILDEGAVPTVATPATVKKETNNKKDNPVPDRVIPEKPSEEDMIFDDEDL